MAERICPITNKACIADCPEGYCFIHRYSTVIAGAAETEIEYNARAYTEDIKKLTPAKTEELIKQTASNVRRILGNKR